jgi:hypothetical protein
MTMKPNGIALGIGPTGPTLSVTKSSHWEDQLWDAVREAVEAGVEPKGFVAEMRQAWKETLEDNMKLQLEALRATT